jgi:hypothetical protein
LIPRIGHDKDQYLSDIREEKNLLLSQFNSTADSRRSGFQAAQDIEETQEFELVRSDNDVIHLQSPDLAESSFVQSTSTAPLTESKSTEKVTRKAIRVDLKSKLLSASLSVSIKMKPGETHDAHSDISSVTHTLDEGSNWAQAAIEQEQTPNNDEGIEIVPVMSGDEPYRLCQESLHSGEETSTVFHYIENKNVSE